MHVFAHYRRRLANAVARMRLRGYPLLTALLFHLPRVTLLRIYRKLAHPMNRALPFRWLNERALRRLHAGNPRHADGGHFYVIVMPGTLHFLLPCLALLPADLRVSLLANGARAFELRQLAASFPALPIARLASMPGTSLTHGDVITLLLNSNTGNFGLLDHDCYIFDRAVFTELAPGPKQCLTAVFGGVSEKTGLTYPETFFLYLNTPVLREIMSRYAVDARIYRAAPARVRPIIERVGLGQGVFYKDYLTFFDTLHLLLGLAVAGGFGLRFLQHVDQRAIAHVGGTSWKTAETKELIDCYIDWRFLEIARDEQLRRRYARRLRPFRSADAVRAAIPMTPEAFARLAAVDGVVDRLRGWVDAAPRPATSLSPAQVA
jgi:hypothetical protein